MKTANISKIAASIPNTQKAKFNLSHDNNTTYDWGSVQPLLGKLMLPDSSININTEQLTRLAPMVVPTFGRVKLKNIAHFIPCAEIWPNWDAMLTQTKVTRSAINTNGTPTASTYVPKKVPYIKNNILISAILMGCKANLYFSGTVGTAQENTWHCARNTGTWGTPAGWPSATTATRSYMARLLGISNSNSPSTTVIQALSYTGYIIRTQFILNNRQGKVTNCSLTGNWKMNLPTITTMTEQPLANANGQGYTHSASNEQNGYDSTIGDNHVSFDGADIIWEYNGQNGTGIESAERTSSGNILSNITENDFDGCKIRITFKLSSFGKRLRKILIGLGYDINLDNNDEVSLLPLLAYYKAWWDTYAPERFKNFYETNAWKIINAAMSGQSGADITAWLNNNNASDVQNYFTGFLGDLGNCFATEKIDCISAATDSYYGNTNSTTSYGINDIQTVIQSTINQILDQPSDGTYNADGSYGIGTSSGTNNNYTNSGIYNLGMRIANNPNYEVLTQPQIDVLKKAYVMMNKTSVPGMKTEEILRALGFGDYVEECKGKFINSSDDTIKISDVIATAATQEAQLGQYGGRGLGLGNFQISYSTKRHGYLIILSAIIPESGYINSPTHENEAISFESIYNPELDGLAYEAIQKKQITGCPLINDDTYKNTFGFLPTYSQWKFMSNKANGDFSLNSRKAYMTPYTLDKYIPVADANVYRVEETNGHAGSTTELCSPTFKYSDLANAGEDWRFINKFPWNGNYNRIFSAEGDGLEWSVFSPNNNAFLFLSFEYDNFMVHNVFEIAYWAHMKPIEESYGTYDEEHGAPNTTIARS